MYQTIKLQDLLTLVEEYSKCLPEPILLVEDQTAIEPRLRFQEKTIFFSNACISTVLLYELYYAHKKNIHRILLYNVLIDINFRKGYLYNVAYLLEKLEAEIRNFQVKCPLIKEPLNTRNMLTFIVGHELWHAKFRFSSTLKEEKLSEIREIIGTIYNEVNTQTFREKIALDGVFNYLNRTKILEELACDKYSIIEFFNNSIPKDLPSDKIVSLAELLVRVIAMRQYPTNISLACNFKLNKDGFLQYRDIHRADITRIGLATSAVCECLIDYLDKTFVEKFKKETLSYSKVLSYTVLDWIKQFNTVSIVSTGKYVDNEQLYNDLQNHFNQLQLRLINIIDLKVS